MSNGEGEFDYDLFIVQSLIGNYNWSSTTSSAAWHPSAMTSRFVSRASGRDEIQILRVGVQEYRKCASSEIPLAVAAPYQDARARGRTVFFQQGGS